MNDTLLNASKKTQYNSIKHLVRLHNKLVDHCNSINKCFEFQLFLILNFELGSIVVCV
uniref:Olfactory receptor n=1 Tax=Apolygus lucorum TaxID=248454 RepID=A0A1Q1NIJ4_APOLU|nr:olfactory receptor [Apolygus lucorum]